jgi:hypothetical protein
LQSGKYRSEQKRSEEVQGVRKINKQKEDKVDLEKAIIAKASKQATSKIPFRKWNISKYFKIFVIFLHNFFDFEKKNKK